MIQQAPFQILGIDLVCFEQHFLLVIWISDWIFTNRRPNKFTCGKNALFRFSMLSSAQLNLLHYMHKDTIGKRSNNGLVQPSALRRTRTRNYKFTTGGRVLIVAFIKPRPFQPLNRIEIQFEANQSITIYIGIQSIFEAESFQMITTISHWNHEVMLKKSGIYNLWSAIFLPFYLL